MALQHDAIWRRPSNGSRFRLSGAAVLMLLVMASVWIFLSRTDVVYSVAMSYGARPSEVQSSKLPESHEKPLASVSSLHASDTLPADHPVAVVIETEMTANAVPVILHFATVLGPRWTIILFTLEDNWVMPKSPAFRRAVANRQIEVRFLPADTDLKASYSVSLFLAKPWLWEQLEQANRTLLFQTDSIICSKSERTVDDFLMYDYVGAPIAPEFGEGYNGGLSIRNPKLFLQITRESDFENSEEKFEDQWFYHEAKARVGQGVNLPEEAVAKTFSVETIYYAQPVGYHQPRRWNANKMPFIEEYCPEVKMLIGPRVTHDDWA